MQRFKFILIPGALAIVIFLSMDFVSRNRQATDSATQQEDIAYNGYSEGINSVQFDVRGQIRYTLSAARQVSYLNAETALEKPFIQLFQENNSRWNINASSGRIFPDSQAPNSVEEIVLTGEVEVRQSDSSENQVVLTTDTLTIDPAEEVLTTGSAVTMVGTNFEQSATGMRVNLKTEEYLFHQDVRGRYATSQN